MQRLVKPGSQEEQVGRLILAAMLVLLLPSIPFGQYLTYPFVILSTWFHEMGHGLTAILLGFEFQQLEIYPSGSGVAITAYAQPPSALSRAMIAAGGPLAPAIVGSLLILASAHQKLWRPVLLGLAVVIGISTLIWVRSVIGLTVLPLVAVIMMGFAWKASDGVMRFTLQFLGIHAALSMFGQWDYLLMENAVIGGQTIPSDTGAIEQALALPHWLWAALIIVTAAVMILASLKYALKVRLPDNVIQFKQ